MEIKEIYEYFKKTKYKPFGIEEHTDTILFDNIPDFGDVVRITAILKELGFNIDKIAYYSGKLIIGDLK